MTRGYEIYFWGEGGGGGLWGGRGYGGGGVNLLFIYFNKTD